MDSRKVGALIAGRRKEKGLTQKELGRRLHVSDRAVSKWERGLNLPDAALFEPLCRELDITVTELLRGGGRYPPLLSWSRQSVMPWPWPERKSAGPDKTSGPHWDCWG